MAFGGIAMLPALIWLIVSHNWLNGAGFMTAFFLVFLGACCGSLDKYRTEPGLWMLAALCLCFTGPVWVLSSWSALQQPPSSNVLSIIDVSLATLVMGITTRILVSVCVHNRQLGKA